jgi:hypothetical protein
MHPLQASEMWLRTTRYHRTYQTLQGVVTGLYPALKPQQTRRAAGDATTSSVEPPVVTVHVSDEAREYEYGNENYCPALKSALQDLQQAVAGASAGVWLWVVY